MRTHAHSLFLLVALISVAGCSEPRNVGLDPEPQNNGKGGSAAASGGATGGDRAEASGGKGGSDSSGGAGGSAFVDGASGGDAVDAPIAPADVVVACGMPGEPCCNKTTCKADGCCAAGSSEIPRCVATGGFCGSVDAGPNRGTCSHGACSSCGAPGGLCCAGRTCGAGGCCVGAADTATCVAVGEICPLAGPGNGGTCASGRCTGCGGPAQPCCDGDICYEPGQACSVGRCEH
jgi:hypothetical protein